MYVFMYMFNVCNFADVSLLMLLFSVILSYEEIIIYAKFLLLTPFYMQIHVFSLSLLS